MVRGVQSSGDWYWEFTIQSTFREAAQVVLQFVDRVAAWGAAGSNLLALQHGLHEALVNAVRHGNGGVDSKRIRVAYRFLDDDVWMEIEDEGQGFRMSEVLDATTDKNQCRPGGRGLLMMRHFMSTVDYNQQGNRVTMQKCQARPKRLGLGRRRQPLIEGQRFAIDDSQLIAGE